MKYIDGIKNDQINASGFGKMMNEAIGSCMRLTIRPTKHIPIQCWSEVSEDFVTTIYIDEPERIVRNSGGKTYLVATINKGDL